MLKIQRCTQTAEVWLEFVASNEILKKSQLKMFQKVPDPIPSLNGTPLFLGVQDPPYLGSTPSCRSRYPFTLVALRFCRSRSPLLLNMNKENARCRREPPSTILWQSFLLAYNHSVLNRFSSYNGNV